MSESSSRVGLGLLAAFAVASGGIVGIGLARPFHPFEYIGLAVYVSPLLVGLICRHEPRAAVHVLIVVVYWSAALGVSFAMRGVSVPFSLFRELGAYQRYEYLGFMGLHIFAQQLVRLGTKTIPAGHCRQCGYNLHLNESGQCPECGVRVETMNETQP